VTPRPGISVPAHSGDASDFDFLEGSWDIRHRKLMPNRQWADFPGTMRHHRLLDGASNAEEYHMAAPGQAYDALALRTFDRKSRQWLIWWLDGRHPDRGLGTPVRGGFSGDTGLFFAEEPVGDQAGLLRFVWRRLADGQARWEQSLSLDGENWSPNWTMDFSRVG
jgi:hypothetical protein